MCPVFKLIICREMPQIPANTILCFFSLSLWPHRRAVLVHHFIKCPVFYRICLIFNRCITNLIMIWRRFQCGYRSETGFVFKPAIKPNALIPRGQGENKPLHDHQGPSDKVPIPFLFAFYSDTVLWKPGFAGKNRGKECTAFPVGLFFFQYRGIRLLKKWFFMTKQAIYCSAACKRRNPRSGSPAPAVSAGAFRSKLLYKNHSSEKMLKDPGGKNAKEI